MQIDKDVIDIISLIVPTFISFFGIWLGCRNRKIDLINFNKQLRQLQEQSETAKEHLSILWQEKERRDLGPNLEAIIKENPYAYKSGKDFLIDITVIIKNPTKHSIKMNNFQIHHKSPFAFVKGGSVDHIIPFIPENEKYMSFKSPFTANLNSQDIRGYFNLKENEQAIFSLTVRHLKPNIETVPIFIIEHTSSNHPERVVQTKFWPEFLLSFEEENMLG
ncbi:hypothetical protein HNQ69_001652 [Bartonella callosciuri]|uniref:Uncharacterized protein n=1 Tax=Bartonella callosciuri TaxID=686223 RepID=A0A840NRP1_9HYPH|nr:hypothetical protein [Bartonella callosciuri]MBB5074500.1 hypothetical protein [Bartonella callosciuri]